MQRTRNVKDKPQWNTKFYLDEEIVRYIYVSRLFGGTRQAGQFY